MNGVVKYTNKTTHLGSEAIYSCLPNFRLEGSSTKRSCNQDGKWNGAAPQCREVRCSTPERVDGAVLSISSSDRLRAVTLLRNTDRGGDSGVSSSFKIGSTVIYKCERGYKLDGRNSRNCDETGQWTGEVTRKGEQRILFYWECGGLLLYKAGFGGGYLAGKHCSLCWDSILFSFLTISSPNYFPLIKQVFWGN